MNTPHSFVILGPEQAEKTLFLSALVQSLSHVEELKPSFILKQKQNILPIRTLEALRQLRTQYLSDPTSCPCLGSASTWFTIHHQKIQSIELSEQDCEQGTFLLQQYLEIADGFFFILPAPLLQEETPQKIAVLLERVLRQLKQFRPQKNYSLFFLLSHAEQLEPNQLEHPENYWKPSSTQLNNLFQELKPSWKWFSIQEDFTNAQGKYPFNAARESFDIWLAEAQKRIRKKKFLYAFTWLFGVALLLIFSVFLQSFLWNQKFDPLFQKTKKEMFLSQVFLKTTQEEYLFYRKQLRELEYSSSLAHFSPWLKLKETRAILEQYRSNLQEHITHFAAYVEAPNQLNYRAEDYQKILQGIEVLNENTSGDSYGAILLQKKMEAAELKEKLPEIRSWGRLYRNGMDILKKQPSKPLKIFIDTIILSELTWAIENVWDQFYQWKPSSKRFFPRCYRFLEINEDFLPPALKLKFERQLETSWQQAFDEIKKQTEAEKEYSERFKLWESLYRNEDGTVIPEADKHMPTLVRSKLKQEITSLLNQWRNEHAEASWDSWFGGRSERKIEQIRQLYQGRHNITTKEEWDRFLSDLQILTHKLHAEISEQSEQKTELDYLQQWLTLLHQELKLTVTYQLQIPDSYHSYFNVFVPQVTLLLQKTEEKSYPFESETQQLNWQPGESIRIQVTDIKYPYQDELKLETPGLNLFHLLGKHTYKQSEDVYITLDFKMEPTLETLEKRVADYWSKNK